MSNLLASPLILLGVTLAVGALLGGAAERIRVPWITGCIIAGVVLGPGVTDVLDDGVLHALEGFTQVALAVIAFNIGSQLVFSRLKEIGRSIVLLAAAQLLAPFFVVLAAESVMGVAFPTALVLAAVAPATAPTTTYSVIRRLNASGPFVDRVLGVLALNDAAAVLIFSVASAAALTLVSADGSAATLTGALLTATTNELVSVVTGLALGVAYLGGRKLIEDGTPGWQARLTAMLLGLLVASIGSAVALGLSHLLVPLSLGVVIANGIDDAERGFLHELIRSFEEPLFIVFFVLAGAHLPLSAAAHAAILAATAVYLAGRFGGKYAGIFATATALKLDPPTRRYLGLCFPSQGALAMGLVLAFRSSPAVSALPPAALQPIEAAVSIILVAVLISQMVGPLLIDIAVRRATATTTIPSPDS